MWSICHKWSCVCFLRPCLYGAFSWLVYLTNAPLYVHCTRSQVVNCNTSCTADVFCRPASGRGTVVICLPGHCGCIPMTHVLGHRMWGGPRDSCFGQLKMNSEQEKIVASTAYVVMSYEFLKMKKLSKRKRRWWMVSSNKNRAKYVFFTLFAFKHLLLKMRYFCAFFFVIFYLII